MSKYLLYKLEKNCAETPNGYQNIAVSLGGLFWRTLCISLYYYLIQLKIEEIESQD